MVLTKGSQAPCFVADCIYNFLPRKRAELSASTKLYVGLMGLEKSCGNWSLMNNSSIDPKFHINWCLMNLQGKNSFSEQLRTCLDIKLCQERFLVTCIWAIAPFNKPKVFVHASQTSSFETCLWHFAEHCWALRSSRPVRQVIWCTCLYPPGDQHNLT